MSSQYPGGVDALTGRFDNEQYVRAAIDALQRVHDRMVSVQRTVSPGASSTVTPDMSLGWKLRINLPAADITLANPINAQPGDFLTLILVEPNQGGALINWGSAYRKSITLSSTGNAIDTVIFGYADTDVLWYQIGAAALAVS